ncbi:MAG: hypothetical protein SFX72_14185 [Isosphaeraceae bacterium]|nr:hypothetical protein [Isosphaeraceae bacterium]
MAATTEAACLVESGALYTRRVGFATEGDPIFVGIKHGAASIYYGDGPFFHFDLEGRWQRLLIDGIHYLKGLDGSVRAIDRVRKGENLILERRTLAYAEVADLDDRVRRTAIDLGDAISNRRFPRLEPPAKKGVRPLEDREALDLLDRITAWDANAWFSHKDRYVKTYSALPFVPPDCMTPLFVQLVEGERGARFGGLGEGDSGVEPAPRSLAEFETHLDRVARLLGARVGQARQVYLCGPTATTLETDDLAAALEAIGRRFPIPEALHRGQTADGDLDPFAIQVDGIHAFAVDFDLLRRRSLDDWIRLRKLRLESITLGVESADRETLRSLGRTWELSDLQAIIRTLDAANIRANLAVIVDLDPASGRRALAESITVAAPRRGVIVSLIRRGDLDSAAGNPEATAPETAADPRDEVRELLAGLRAGGVKVVPFLPEKRWI